MNEGQKTFHLRCLRVMSLEYAARLRGLRYAVEQDQERWAGQPDATSGFLRGLIDGVEWEARLIEEQLEMAEARFARGEPPPPDCLAQASGNTMKLRFPQYPGKSPLAS